MTYDEACVTIATASGAMSPAEMADFFAMPRDQQEATAQLYRGAVFAAQGASGWSAFLAALGTAATIFGDASGIAGAYSVFKAL